MEKISAPECLEFHSFLTSALPVYTCTITTDNVFLFIDFFLKGNNLFSPLLSNVCEVIGLTC